MRIRKLVLKNYIGIKNGLQLKSIKLDFNDKNIILIIGENGSGKTTIMEALSPLADNKMIIPGKTGHKEIELEKDNVVYKIQHIHQPNGKSSHKVSSFIQREIDGISEELNKNGNVTSFNKVILEELGISDEYLSMIRLGSAFNSFISKSTSERSKYMSKFLEGVDVYLKYHKKVSNDARVLKTILKNVTDKLSHIGNGEDLKIRIEAIEDKLVEFNNHKLKLSNNIAIIEKIISDIDISDIDDIGIEEDLIDDMMENIKLVGIDISKVNADSFKVLVDNIYNTSKDRLSKLKDELKENYIKISEFDESIEDLEVKIDNIDEEKNKELIKSYNNKYLQCKLLEEEFGFDLEENIPKYTKKELFQAIKVLDDIFAQIEDLHTYFDEEMFNEIYTSGNSVDHYKKEYGLLDQKKLTKSQELTFAQAKLVAVNERYKTIQENLDKKPDNCLNYDCPLLGGNISVIEQQISDLEETVDSLKKEIESIDTLRIRYGDMVNIMETIITLGKNFDRSYEIIKIVPFVKSKFTDYNENILQCKPLYENEELENCSDTIDSYNRYVTVKESIYNISELYYKAVADMENITKYRSELNSAIHSKNMLENKAEKIKTEQKELNDKFDIISDIYDNLDLYAMILEYKNNLDQLIANKAKLIESKAKLNRYNESLEKLEDALVNLNAERDKTKMKYQQYCKFVKEKEFLEDKFKDVEMVQKALSPNKGIPLVFIDIYLQQARIIANDLLDEAFNGKYHLEDFIINEKEFKIPFTKTEYVEDVSKGSEGEKAIISLVLSFAFIKNIACEFDIMFLDEIDGPLDKMNRKSFAHAIQTQMDIMDMEQLFLISHNDSFLTKDVGYILLKNHNMNNVNKKNIIYEY